MNSDFIWVEKYRPKTIDDCILPESTKTMFREFLNKGEIPNMLLAGPPGIGKTTVAKALCNELDAVPAKSRARCAANCAVPAVPA